MGERQRYFVLHGMRVVEGSGAYLSPQSLRYPAASRAGRERVSALPGRWSMPNSKWPRMASAVLSRWVNMMGGMDGERKREGSESNTTYTQLNCNTWENIHTHSYIHSQTVHLHYPLNLSLSYIHRAGPVDPCTPPHIPVCDPPSVCLLVQASCRCTSCLCS